MNELQVFSNPEFGQVRTLTLEGEPWFVGKDVAVALGYSNPQKAIRDHVDDEDKTVNDSFTVNGTPPILINESGLYALIFGSKLESAKNFKRWVTHEVLPAIRKTGVYSLTPQRRELTVDDYMKAAQLAATCRNERLPYVLGFLEQAGFNIPKVQEQPQADIEGPVDCGLIQRLMDAAGITQDELSRRTNICKASLSYYRRGIHKPPRERYQIIINALT